MTNTNKSPQTTVTMNQVHKTYIECRRIAYVWYKASKQDEAANLALDKMLDSLQDMVRGIEEEAYGEAMTTFNESEPISEETPNE